MKLWVESEEAYLREYMMKTHVGNTVGELGWYRGEDEGLVGFCIKFDGLAPGVRLVHVGLVLKLMIKEWVLMCMHGYKHKTSFIKNISEINLNVTAPPTREDPAKTMCLA